jgi:hypothetical protein
MTSAAEQQIGGKGPMGVARSSWLHAMFEG